MSPSAAGWMRIPVTRARLARASAAPSPAVRGGAQLDALRAPNRVLEMQVATGAENDRHHQAQTEKREVL